MNIFGRTNKRVSDKVDVLFYGEKNVVSVFLGERRQVDMLAGHVHTLACTKLTVVLNLRYEHRTLHVEHLHVQLAVVEENAIAHLHVVGDVGIRHVQYVVRCLHFGATEYFHDVSTLILNGFCNTGGSYFRSFGVYHQGDVRRNGTHILNDFLHSLFGGMRGVHSHHIHPSEKKLSYKFLITPAVADGGHNLCLFHILLKCPLNIM